MYELQKLFQIAISNNDLAALEDLCKQMDIVYEILATQNVTLDFIPVVEVPFNTVSPELILALSRLEPGKVIKISNCNPRIPASYRTELMMGCYKKENRFAGEALIADGVAVTELDRKTVIYQFIPREYRNAMEARLSLETLKEELLKPLQISLGNPLKMMQKALMLDGALIKGLMQKILTLDGPTLGSFVDEITAKTIENPFNVKQWDRIEAILKELWNETEAFAKFFKIVQFGQYKHPELPQVIKEDLSFEQKKQIREKAQSLADHLFRKGEAFTIADRELLQNYLMLQGASTSIEENKIITAATQLLNKLESDYPRLMQFPDQIADKLTPQQQFTAQIFLRETLLAVLSFQLSAHPRNVVIKPFALTVFNKRLPNGKIMDYNANIATDHEKELTMFIDQLSLVLADVRINEHILGALIRSLLNEKQIQRMLTSLPETRLMAFFSNPNVLKILHLSDYNFLDNVLPHFSKAAVLELMDKNPLLRFTSKNLDRLMPENKNNLVVQFSDQLLPLATLEHLALAVESDSFQMFNYLYNKRNGFPLLLSEDKASNDTLFKNVLIRIIRKNCYAAVETLIVDSRFKEFVSKPLGDLYGDIHTVLMAAIGVAKLDVFKLLLAQVKFGKYRFTTLNILLDIAAMRGLDDYVEYLLSLYQEDEKIPGTVLMSAFKSFDNTCKVMQRLIDSKRVEIIPINLDNRAMSQVNHKNIALLLKSNLMSQADIEKFLHVAVSTSDADLAKIFFNSKLVDINLVFLDERRCYSETVLMMALRIGGKFVEAFLSPDYKINFSLQSSEVCNFLSSKSEGRTLLDFCVESYPCELKLEEQIKKLPILKKLLHADFDYAAPKLAEYINIFNSWASFVEVTKQTISPQNRVAYKKDFTDLVNTLRNHLLAQTLLSTEATIKLLCDDESKIRPFVPTIIIKLNKDHAICRAKALAPLCTLINELKTSWTIALTDARILMLLNQSINAKSNPSLLTSFINEVVMNPNFTNPLAVAEWDRLLRLASPLIKANTGLNEHCVWTALSQYTHPDVNKNKKVVKVTISQEIDAIRESANQSSSSSSSSNSNVILEQLSREAVILIDMQINKFKVDLAEAELTADDYKKLLVLLEPKKSDPKEFRDQQKLLSAATEILEHADLDHVLNFIENASLLAPGKIKSDTQKKLALEMYVGKLRELFVGASLLREPVVAAPSVVATESSAISKPFTPQLSAPPSDAEILSRLSSIIVPTAPLLESVDDDEPVARRVAVMEQ